MMRGLPTGSYTAPTSPRSDSPSVGGRELALPLVRVHPLIVIVLLAAVLRLWGLSSLPVLYFDAGAYLGEGRFLANAAERAAEAWSSPGPGNPLERVVHTLQNGTAGHP